MADAGQLIVPMRGALIPVPSQPQVGVCAICHSSAKPGFATCRPCTDAARLNPPEILPIALSVHGGLLHAHLRGYKDSPSVTARVRMSLRLAGVLAMFMAQHEGCIGEWDIVTCVPSPGRVALQPVVTRVRELAGRFRQVLAAQPDADERTMDPEQFAVTEDVAGRRVLLLDDTFVSGAKLFSAVAALRRRDAVVVGPVVIGRHIQRGWPPSADLLSWIEERAWSERRCARCAGERRSGTLF